MLNTLCAYLKAKSDFSVVCIMSKPPTLLSKIILIVVVLSIFAICLYALKPRIDTSVFLLFFLVPVLIIILGKTAELIIRLLEKVSTGPLSLIGPQTTLLLMCYYASLSTFLALLIENSAILSILNFRPDEWQVAIISLSLAFFPRVLSYASGTERARNVLLAILTPLTLTAAVVLFIQPATIALRLQTLEFCIVGSLIQPIIGDLTLYFAGFLGIIHPEITIETISLLDLRQLVHSKLETIQWDSICQILKEAKQVNRVDIIQKILESMKFFIDDSRKRAAKLAQIDFIDALSTTIRSEPNLVEELFPLFEAFKNEKEAEVRAHMAYGYAAMSKVMPDKSLQGLSGLLDDKDISVLQAVGSAFTILLKSNSKAVSHAIRLSLNPVFLKWLFKETQFELRRRGHVYPPWREESPILKALKAAYANSPDAVFAHIQRCSSNKDVKIRVLAAKMVSDPFFAQDEKRLVQIRERLKKDKSAVIRDIIEFYRIFAMLVRLPSQKS